MKKGEIVKKVTSPAIIGESVPGTLFATTTALIGHSRELGERDDPFFEVLDMLSLPIEIFAPDGTLVYLNRAMAELNNVTDVSLAIGKYNVLQDPVCMDQLGFREEIEDVFIRRFKSICRNFPAPINDVFERGVIDEKPYEAATMDIYAYPINRKGKLLFVVLEFHVKNIYHGRPEVARAKEYIDTHWKDKYDKAQLSKAVNMSVSQLYRIFTEQAGMPPGDYHKRVKVEHIKEKLSDKSLSVKEAFAACGEDSHSWLSTVFKQITGLSPTEYRNSLL